MVFINQRGTRAARHALPDYTRGEEIFNMVSHIAGGGFAVLALVACVVVAIVYDNTWGIASGAIYGVTMIILYAMSSLYHGLKREKAKIVFRVFDHCCIFLLISGTYTPLTLCTLNGTLGWWIFGVNWGFAILGIVLNALSIERFKVFSMICYIGMGWMVVFAIKPLIDALPLPALLYLLGGGIAYTGGVIFYAFGKKAKYIHSVWHLFVVLGSVLHFVCILVYVMPIKEVI